MPTLHDKQSMVSAKVLKSRSSGKNYRLAAFLMNFNLHRGVRALNAFSIYVGNTGTAVPESRLLQLQREAKWTRQREKAWMVWAQWDGESKRRGPGDTG